MYSNNWKDVKKIAYTMVKINPVIVSRRDPSTSAAWDQVKVEPEIKSKTVFNKGINQGLTVRMLWGGQTAPSSGTAFKQEWKYAQKKAKKSMISETIKRIIPKRNPCWTRTLCFPSNVASRTISRNQEIAMKSVMKKPKKKKKSPNL